MRIRTLAMVTAASVLLLVGSATVGAAQTPAHDMSDMMAGPHHTLAMAYHESLAAFARALQGSVTKSKAVDIDMARPAVAEMRRSFDLMQQHHQSQMSQMSHMSQMTMMPDSAMRAMAAHGTMLAGHLAALETEVNAAMPDRDKVLEHTAEILKMCADMHAKMKP